jgi:hypothetical protein
MTSQIFKTSFSKDILYDFLEIIATKKTNCFLLTKVNYKSAVFQKLIDPFLDSIKEHYFASKKKYVTRKMNYKNFVTVIRQICKFHHIPFSSNIKYDKSSYEIEYNIYFTEK